jgi:octaprenyl-diphosphate synthase
MSQAALQDQDAQNPLNTLADQLHNDMAQVNAIILDRMQSDVPMIPQLAAYLIAAGGKRIRPLLTLACASLCGDESDNPKKLAAAVEFIHTATLLHDDVVDGSDQRRGKPSANTVFGNQETVLVGDFLFARAFELMVETGNLKALESLSRAARIITEGEVLQLCLIGNTNITRDQYFKVIEAKTAALFTAACEVAPILQNQPADNFATYGHGLGMAFQIVDDVMDYTSPKMGKNKGDDFMEGKITLPVIIALEEATNEDRDFLIKAMENPSQDHLNPFIETLVNYHAFEKSIAIAEEFCETASEALSNYDSDIAGALIDLPQSILNRTI